MSTPNTTTPEREPPRDEPHNLEAKLAEYARVGLPVLTVAIALTAGFVQGPASAILVLAGGALVGVIAIFWASVRTLLGETALSGADAYALAAPRSEEEQKRAVLRALKDLEFERSVGKISEEDYVELVARYRGEAKRLLRLLDDAAGPRRERAAALVAKRLRREGLGEPGVGGYRGDPKPTGESDDEPIKPAADTTDDDVNDVNDVNTDADSADSADSADRADRADRNRDRKGAGSDAKPTKGKKRKKPRDPAAVTAAAPEAPAPEAATRDCAACGTKNDPDAVFCKKCGARQEAEAAATTAPATTTTSNDDAEDAS